MPYIGEKVLTEGSFLYHNALSFYMDKERHYPIDFNFLAMWQNLMFEIDGKTITLAECIAHLSENEKFAWIIYASFNHPLGDKMFELEILPNPDIAGFLTVKINKKITEKNPLETPSNFKILVIFTKNDAFKQFLNKGKANVAFGFQGKGQRSGTS
jgi:hypothetical protein